MYITQGGPEEGVKMISLQRQTPSRIGVAPLLLLHLNVHVRGMGSPHGDAGERLRRHDWVSRRSVLDTATRHRVRLTHGGDRHEILIAQQPGAVLQSLFALLRIAQFVGHSFPFLSNTLLFCLQASNVC